ncbi:hypothetical protein E1B28_011263 [Marasmius oreades]|uniref:Ribonuclease n=1 Tax=Marasmius oreades TaxID=181124 RepID=A0A9P7UR10_9AGAR|nr:uncharacterized protein E1B28_011263 [Marasmius oreades]KAG7089596.1 hypothetical protein E1B28_011263 [Marasmius oreades]
MTKTQPDSPASKPHDQESSGLVPSSPGPSTPITQSYTYHSPTPTATGPYILGVDEAGRGPVLGPLIYGVAYCPESYMEELEGLGFADSKTLTAATRSTLLKTLRSDEENLGWSVRVICPQAISSGMLRRPPINLNRQSQEATVMLIQEILKKGIALSEVYVDALGNTTTYQAYLSSQFPNINFTVESKADFKFKIVGAASVAAKVTRDACLEEWTFEEPGYTPPNEAELGSGYPSGQSIVSTFATVYFISKAHSSPDPKTQAWLKNCLEPTFGFPKVVRFSWTTVKVLLEKEAYRVKWMDEGQASLIKAFESGQGLDKDRCLLTKELGIRSIGTF